MAAPQSKPTVERDRQALNGWLALALVVLWFIAAVAVFASAGTPDENFENGSPLRALVGLFMLPVGIFLCFGFFTRARSATAAFTGPIRSSRVIAVWCRALLRWRRSRRTEGRA